MFYEQLSADAVLYQAVEEDNSLGEVEESVDKGTSPGVFDVDGHVGEATSGRVDVVVIVREVQLAAQTSAGRAVVPVGLYQRDIEIVSLSKGVVVGQVFIDHLFQVKVKILQVDNLIVVRPAGRAFVRP